ncbi:hypothetical protein U5801_05445 [Lamprobacter modestohalophilus]|uniref:hypothetical protein n=1 Tax=Lamprobacter modestohalophilus TaxID=1064514 RepID=UPI002ADEB3AC|nr:hypothetical protein [Lamprobacter modestohalophilus]MEA1049250.1 hypothetical protein [Lamprobacter modestohalophilus]
MFPNQLRLRCYAEHQGPRLWVAVCIDLCLAAQGETCEEARNKLDAQIDQYVEEAFTVDRAYFDQLIPRKAPLRQRVKYYLAHLHIASVLLRRSVHDFIRGMPLTISSQRP